MKASTKQINLIFENCTHVGELPNGIDINNEKLLKLLVKHNWLWHGKFLHEYRDIFGNDVSVFLNYLPISTDFFWQRMLYEFTTPHRPINKHDVYFVPLGVYGSIDNLLGMNPNTKSSIELLSDKIIDLINENDNVYLLINHTDEGYFTKENVTKIIVDCRNKKIKSGKVIYATACYNAQDVFKQYFKELNTNYEINTLYYNWALESCAKHWLNILNRPNDYKFYEDIQHYETITTEKDVLEKKDKLRDNKFLSFNNKLRSHRLYFLSILKNNGELNNNLISYDLTDLDFEGTKNQYTEQLQDYNFTEEEVNFYLDSYNLEKQKQTVDLENIRDARGHGWDRNSVYLDSYINLTTETLFFDDCWYISEKIFKPIANLQPFVVIGSPHILLELKKLGFKTFDKWWDESYDTELNHTERLRKVHGVIDKLSSMSLSEIHDMYYKILPDLIYNQQKLFSYEIKKPNQKEFAENLKNFMPYGSRLS